MSKLIVYLDMDDCLANFADAAGIPRGLYGTEPPAMFEPGFFRNLKLVDGAKEAVAELSKLPFLDLYIASKHSYKNALSASEKIEWIKEHFPELQSKMFLTCDKGHLNGDYLVDDSAEWLDKFPGTVLRFDPVKPKESWEDVVSFFKEGLASKL